MAESATQAWQPRKIARIEWSIIADRYRQGESFASIARAYNCTGPAIRYIVRRELQLRGGETAESPLSSALPTPSGSADRAASTTGLGADLRDATTGEVANFLVAFDHALEDPSAASLTSLRGATDRLLRAVARVRIALEPVVDPAGKIGRV